MGANVSWQDAIHRDVSLADGSTGKIEQDSYALIGLFLLVAGLTGEVISWDHELDEWLSPDLFEARSSGPAQAPLALADALEASDPRLRVSWLSLTGIVIWLKKRAARAQAMNMQEMRGRVPA